MHLQPFIVTLLSVSSLIKSVPGIKPQKSFSLSNLSTDFKSEAFFFSGLSSLDLLCALPSWDFVSCNLVSMAFRLSRIGADILLAGQLQDPVQQIYIDSTFVQHVISGLHILSCPKILQLIHPRVRKNTFTGQRRTHKRNRCCIMLISVARGKFTLGNSITQIYLLTCNKHHQN